MVSIEIRLTAQADTAPAADSVRRLSRQVLLYQSISSCSDTTVGRVIGRSACINQEFGWLLGGGGGRRSIGGSDRGPDMELTKKRPMRRMTRKPPTPTPMLTSPAVKAISVARPRPTEMTMIPADRNRGPEWRYWMPSTD